MIDPLEGLCKHQTPKPALHSVWLTISAGSRVWPSAPAASNMPTQTIASKPHGKALLGSQGCHFCFPSVTLDHGHILFLGLMAPTPSPKPEVPKYLQVSLCSSNSSFFQFLSHIYLERCACTCTPHGGLSALYSSLPDSLPQPPSSSLLLTSNFASYVYHSESSSCSILHSNPSQNQPS